MVRLHALFFRVVGASILLIVVVLALVQESEWLASFERKQPQRLITSSGIRLASLFEALIPNWRAVPPISTRFRSSQPDGHCPGKVVRTTAYSPFERRTSVNLPRLRLAQDLPPEESGCSGHYMSEIIRECCSGVFYSWFASTEAESLYSNGYEEEGSVCDGWCANEVSCWNGAW